MPMTTEHQRAAAVELLVDASRGYIAGEPTTPALITLVMLVAQMEIEHASPLFAAEWTRSPVLRQLVVQALCNVVATLYEDYIAELLLATEQNQDDLELLTGSWVECLMNDLALVVDAVEDEVRQLDPDEPLDILGVVERAWDPNRDLQALRSY